MGDGLEWVDAREPMRGDVAAARQLKVEVPVAGTVEAEHHRRHEQRQRANKRDAASSLSDWPNQDGDYYQWTPHSPFRKPSYPLKALFV